MRILIVGAGALGGLVGAYLTRAGENVTLLEVNTARARLLAEAGLQITRAGEGEVRVNVHVVTTIADLPPFDLVFIAVKTYQTEEAMRGVMAATGPGTRFLTMQNGIGNAEIIARFAGPERTLCGITYNSVQHAGPGRLQFRAGIKPIQIAPFAGDVTAELEAIGDVFRGAGLDTNVVPGIDHVVWQKLLHNAVINPVSAVTGLTCRELLGDADLLAFMRDLCREIVAVMRARGVPIVDEEDPFRPLIGSLKALGKNRPTMWQDLARGMRTEVDALNGAVVAEAERLGLSAPHNAALVRFIHSRERQKFLNKQEIAARLGLDRSADRGATADGPVVRARPAAAGVGAGPGAGPAAVDGSGDEARVPGPPLESTRRLRELIQTYYRDLDAASRAPGRAVAACSSLAPVEIVRAMGLVPYFPENHAALISARGLAASCIVHASAEGFSQFASSGMRADIGACLEGTSPLAAAHGISGPPRPDVVVYSTNTGHELVHWFEFYGERYGVPVLGLHPPPALQELERIDIDAAVAQLLRLTSELGRATGRTLDDDRLCEVVECTAQAAALWGEILALGQSVPAPLTFFDAQVHLAPMVLLRGTQAAVDYYRQLKAEIEDRVAQGVAAVPGECHRFYWDGPPIWHARRPLARLFADRGVAVVASTFCSVFTLPGLDPHNPVETMAKVYTSVFGNRSEDYKTGRLAAHFEQYGVDAAVFHDCRTTPEASHVRYGLAVRTERLTGVPAFVIEADSHDPRLFSSDPLRGSLSDFLERHLEHVGAA